MRLSIKIPNWTRVKPETLENSALNRMSSSKLFLQGSGIYEEEKAEKISRAEGGERFQRNTILPDSTDLMYIWTQRDHDCRLNTCKNLSQTRPQIGEVGSKCHVQKHNYISSFTGKKCSDFFVIVNQIGSPGFEYEEDEA